MGKHFLKNTNSFQKNLFFWIKEYIAFKAMEIANSNNGVLTISELTLELLKDAKEIKQLKKEANKLADKGFGSLRRLMNGTYTFYNYALIMADSFEKINTSFMVSYVNSISHLSNGTKSGYINVVLELLEFISKSNIDGFIFDVSYELLRFKNENKTLSPDILSSSEYETIINNVVHYSYKNDYEMARNILIIRVLLYSGITTKELLSLEVNKHFIFEESSISIRLDNRKVVLEMPKDKLIQYYDSYKEESLKRGIDVTIGKLFTLPQQYINIFIKELFLFCNIKKAKPTTKLLRYSCFVYIYNKRNEDNSITYKTVKDMSGIINKSEFDRILGLDNRKLKNTSQILSEV